MLLLCIIISLGKIYNYMGVISVLEEIKDILENNSIKSRGHYSASVQHGVKISGVTKNQFKKLESELRAAGIRSVYALQRAKDAITRAKRRENAAKRRAMREARREASKKQELVRLLAKIKRSRWAKQSESQWNKISDKGNLNKEEFIDFATSVREYNIAIADAVEEGLLPRVVQPIMIPNTNKKGRLEKFMSWRRGMINAGVSGKISNTWDKLARNLTVVYRGAAPQIYMYMKEVGMAVLDEYMTGRGVPLYWLIKSDIPNIDDIEQKEYVMDMIEQEMDASDMIRWLTQHITEEQEFKILNNLDKVQSKWQWNWKSLYMRRVFTK